MEKIWYITEYFEGFKVRLVSTKRCEYAYNVAREHNGTIYRVIDGKKVLIQSYPIYEE